MPANAGSIDRIIRAAVGPGLTGATLSDAMKDALEEALAIAICMGVA
ncbi:MAG: hypothetical protein ACI83P_002697 [Janthinobacterium sp.]|jgi:hypothetical protein